MAAAVHAVRKKHAAARKRNDGVEINGNVIEIFEKYDADGSGDIDKTELADALKDLGMDVPRTKLNGIMKKYCKRDADGLDIDTFDILVSDLKGHMRRNPPNQEALVEPFVAHSIFGKNKPLPFQAKVRQVYTHPAVVWTVAGFIIGNFLVNIIEKEIGEPRWRIQLIACHGLAYGSLR